MNEPDIRARDNGREYVRTTPSLREFLARPEVTEQYTLRGRFGVMAYHGGNLERTTDAIARDVAERADASFYAVTQDVPHRHHLPSSRFVPDESPALARFLDHVDVVLTIHGYGRRRLRRHLLLGGQNRELAGHVAGHLRAALPDRYRVVDTIDEIPRELRGLHAQNPVNHPAQRGVQLELPPSIRWNLREWGWSDHEGTSRTSHVERLIDGLAAAVTAWKDPAFGRSRERRASTAPGSLDTGQQ
jgi:phage replication-related protein YjqB (UPF0714/DUF867 family)